MVASVDTSAVFRADTPFVLLDAPNRLRFDSPVSVAPDGSRFLVHKPAVDRDVPLRVVVNWIEELKHAVPLDER
jgi:hypothetical protein